MADEQRAGCGHLPHTAAIMTYHYYKIHRRKGFVTTDLIRTGGDNRR
jgi:hypothetical protein